MWTLVSVPATWMTGLLGASTMGHLASGSVIRPRSPAAGGGPASGRTQAPTKSSPFGGPRSSSAASRARSEETWTRGAELITDREATEAKANAAGLLVAATPQVSERSSWKLAGQVSRKVRGLPAASGISPSQARAKRRGEP